MIRKNTNSKVIGSKWPTKHTGLPALHPNSPNAVGELVRTQISEAWKAKALELISKETQFALDRPIIINTTITRNWSGN